MLLDSRGQPKDPNAMDISCVCEEDWAREAEFGDFDVGAEGRVTSRTSARSRKARATETEVSRQNAESQVRNM